MKQVRVLLIKEFKQVFRNKGMLPIIFLVPIIQLLILVNAANFEIKKIDFAVYDPDQSQLSHQLVQELQSSGYYHLVANIQSYRQGQEYMDQNQIDLLLMIPNQFESTLLREGKAALMVDISAIDGSAASVIFYYTNTIISGFNKQIVAQWNRRPPKGRERQLIESRFWYNPELEYKNYMTPGLMVVLVTMVGMFLSSMNVVREKEIGTIEQLNVTPITKTQFIISKLFPFWVIGLFELAFGLAIGKLIFDFPVLGSLPLLFGFAAFYLTVVLGIGLFISTVTNTQQQAMLISWFFMVIFILMSGLFTAIENMPPWAQVITWFNPMAYFVEVIRMVLLKGSEFHNIVRHFSVILIMSLVINSLAIFTYRKRS